MEVKPLEYSEETLGKRIKAMRLINIQGIKDITIPFPKNGIVRIHAPSETGKSAFFKPLEPLVLPTYRNKIQLNSLVNKDSTTGEILLELYNGTVVGLHLDTTNLKSCCYMIRYPDGKVIKLPYDTVPHQVTDALGWFTSDVDGTKYCLNVRLEPPLSLIHTSDRLNGEIFGVALHDEKLEETIKLIKTRLDQSNILQEKVADKLNQIEKQMYIPIVDTVELESKLELAKTLEYQYESLLNLDKSITDIYNLSLRKPVLTEAPKEYPQLSKELFKLSNLEGVTYNIISTLEGKVEPPLDVNLDAYYEISSQLKTLDALGNSVNSLLTLDKKEEPVSTQDASALLTQLSRLNKLETLTTSINNQSTNLTKSKLELDKTKLERLLRLIEAIVTCKTNIQEVNKDLAKISEEKSKYQCPTCKQFYVDDAHNH